MQVDYWALCFIRCTISQSLTSHTQLEQTYRNKARRARLETTIREYTALANKYKSLLDSNQIAHDLIANIMRSPRGPVSSGASAPVPRPLPGSSGPSGPAHQSSQPAQRYQVARSTRPLDIPDRVSDMQIPSQYICPITAQIMTDPVLTTDGHVYERNAIQQWLQTHNTSPITKAVVSTEILIPCFALKSLIEEFIDTA